MFVDESGRLIVCPRGPLLHCPADPCPGRENSAVCRHLDTLRTWRSVSREEQNILVGHANPGLDPAVRDAVNACSWRGPVLPISMQDDCGCRGVERSECRAGRGAIPGRVTLRECLQCRGG